MLVFLVETDAAGGGEPGSRTSLLVYLGSLEAARLENVSSRVVPD